MSTVVIVTTMLIAVPLLIGPSVPTGIIVALVVVIAAIE